MGYSTKRLLFGQVNLVVHLVRRIQTVAIIIRMDLPSGWQAVESEAELLMVIQMSSAFTLLKTGTT